jgi:predicted DNA binding protein
MFQVSLSVDLSCPWIAHLAERYGARVKLLQCVPRATGGGTSALAKVSGVQADADAMTRSVRDLPSVEDATFTNLRQDVLLGMVTTRACPCTATALPHCNVIQAVAQEGERLRWTLLMRGGEGLRQLTEDLRKQGVGFRVEEVVRLRRVWSLTDRQEQLLTAALELGFYDVPRKVDLRELARLFNVSPRAMSEALRRAHKRIVSQVLSPPSHHEG